jgi:hypothetical protein
VLHVAGGVDNARCLVLRITGVAMPRPDLRPPRSLVLLALEPLSASSSNQPDLPVRPQALRTVCWEGLSFLAACPVPSIEVAVTR